MRNEFDITAYRLTEGDYTPTFPVERDDIHQVNYSVFCPNLLSRASFLLGEVFIVCRGELHNS